VRGKCKIAVVTRSERGSVILAGDTVTEVAAEKVDKVVDTTGAGDLYAAGFLFGLSRGLDMAACGKLGGLAAAEVISHIGARPQVSLKELATARYPTLMKG
jgi:sugar/nucleoside kinase (ribokinase family)